MILGETLLCPGGGEGNDVTYFGKWIPTRGNAVTLVCDLINTSDSDATILTLAVQTKSTEDDDKNALTLVTAGIGPQEGQYPVRAGETLGGAGQGLLELMRVTMTLVAPEPDQLGWVHTRVLDPIWLTNNIL